VHQTLREHNLYYVESIVSYYSTCSTPSLYVYATLPRASSASEIVQLLFTYILTSEGTKEPPHAPTYIYPCEQQTEKKQASHVPCTSRQYYTHYIDVLCTYSPSRAMRYIPRSPLPSTVLYVLQLAREYILHHIYRIRVDYLTRI
jgi:hypothetical protein